MVSHAIVIPLASVCVTCSCAARQADNNSDLGESVKTRAASVLTFKAQVKVTQLDGSGKKALAKDRYLFADWLSRNKPDLPWQENKKYAESLEKAQAPRLSFFRYFTQVPGKIRIEDFGSADNGPEAFGRKPEIRIFAEEKWYEYTPPDRIPKGGGWGSLWIPQQGLPYCPAFDVARTQAIKMSPFLKGSNRALGIGQMDWEEFLGKGCSRKSLMEALPSGGPPLPILEICTAPPEGQNATPSQPKTTQGLYRVRVWLDSKRGYLPVRMHQDHLNYNVASNDYSYLPDLIVEWSDPVQLGNGMLIHQKCILHVFTHFGPPVQNEPDANRWPEKAYEFGIEQIEFSDIHVNEPLDAGLFNFVPPPNTNVIDEVSGFHYATGSTGELIKKEALNYQREFPPPKNPGSSTWKKAILGALLLAIGVVGFLVFLRLMRPATASKLR